MMQVAVPLQVQSTYLRRQHVPNYINLACQKTLTGCKFVMQVAVPLQVHLGI